MDFSGRTLLRTRDWEAPLKLQPSPPIGVGEKSYQTFGPQEEPSVGRTEKAVRIKAKAKTRGTPTSETAASITNASSDHIPITQTIDSLFETEDVTVSSDQSIKVQARDLEIFESLFYQPCQTAAPGQVKWVAFLQTLASRTRNLEVQRGSLLRHQS